MGIFRMLKLKFTIYDITFESISSYLCTVEFSIVEQYTHLMGRWAMSSDSSYRGPFEANCGDVEYGCRDECKVEEGVESSVKFNDVDATEAAPESSEKDIESVGSASQTMSPWSRCASSTNF